MKYCHLKALCCFVLEKIQAAFSFLAYCIAYFLLIMDVINKMVIRSISSLTGASTNLIICEI